MSLNSCSRASAGWTVCFAAILGLPGGLGGCKAQPKANQYADLGVGGIRDTAARPPPIDPTVVPTRDDIVSIRVIWGNLPWLMDADRRAVGVKARVYFVAGETEAGSFVDGVIGAEVYEIDSTRPGRPVRTLLHEWKFDRDEALGYRIRRKSVMGYSYGMVLVWPESLEVIGHQIEVVFTYERGDGSVIKSGRKRFRVPVPFGYRPSVDGG